MDSPADPADLPDRPDPADLVSGAAARNLPSTRAGGQDDVSSKQTPSNKVWHEVWLNVYRRRVAGGTRRDSAVKNILVVHLRSQ